MEVETFDNNGEVIDASDRRAILVYRVDYDAVVSLLGWTYRRMIRFGGLSQNLDVNLKLAEIKLLLERHQSYSGEVKP